jgi:F-type H+-transporting ATPase subunit alpha
MPVEKQVAIIFAASKGFLDSVPIEDVADWEKGYHAFMADKHSGVLHTIAESGQIDDDTAEDLTAAIKEYAASRG